MRGSRAATLVLLASLATAVTGRAQAVDPSFTQPYVDVDEWRDTPVRHRVVHGGFRGTATRFTIYFPPKERFQGRFFQPLPAAPGQDIAFAMANGAYLVDVDAVEVVPWRASGAVATYSRQLAAHMYGAGRIYGYVYGGQALGSIENTVDVWDGAVPDITDGPVHAGRFSGKVIVLSALKDRQSVPGSKTDERFRRWFADNVRAVNVQGLLQQTILDITAWVENGTSPNRDGIQPVVTVTANGGARAGVAVGERVRFSGVIEVPAHAGVVVAAEWDFEGAGDYPVVETLNEGFNGWRGPENQENPVRLEASYAFSKPGTYFPALRAASQRNGDANTPFTRVYNLGRVRVVVK